MVVRQLGNSSENCQDFMLATLFFSGETIGQGGFCHCTRCNVKTGIEHGHSIVLGINGTLIVDSDGRNNFMDFIQQLLPGSRVEKVGNKVNC